MTASELREWIALFLPDLIADRQGGAREMIPTGLTYDVPAKVRNVSGTEVFSGDQTAQRVSYEITIRWMPEITASHRVWWRGMYLDIESIDNESNRDTWLILKCSRREKGAQ